MKPWIYAQSRGRSRESGAHIQKGRAKHVWRGIGLEGEREGDGLYVKRLDCLFREAG